MKLLIFTLIQLLSFSISQNNRLVFLYTHFRHGARAPMDLDDNCIDLVKEKWDNPGELTGIGQRMHYLLGLRNRIKYIKNETFLNALISVLFLPKIHYKIMEKIRRPVKDLFNYKGDFDPKAKNRLYLEKFIIENYTPAYMRGLISNPHKIFLDLNKIEKKLQEKCKLAKIECNLNMSVPYSYYMEVINDFFSKGYLKECKEYHQTISEATGIQCGLSYHDDRKCILYLLNKNLKYIKNDFSFEIVKTKYVDNVINTQFMNEFKECKMLYLLLMYNYLFNQILSNNIVSKALLAHVELLNPNEIHKNKKCNIEEEDNLVLNIGDVIKSNTKEKKVKNNKIQNLSFSSISKVMYYKDFTINEFNLYSNEILSKYFYNGQVEYNATVFGVILNYLNGRDVLRPEIYLFLTKLINDLILYEDNNKKHLLKLRDYHVTIIKNIFKKNAEQIIKRMNKIEISEDDLKKIYEFFWEKGEGGRGNIFGEYDLIIHDFMEDCLFLMNKKGENKEKIYNEKLETLNKLDIKNLEIKIRLYFLKLFFDVYDGVFDGKIREIKSEDLTEENKNNLKEIIINNFNKLINKEDK
jgi:hypothetical protein